jgi:hypothetical protein
MYSSYYHLSQAGLAWGRRCVGSTTASIGFGAARSFPESPEDRREANAFGNLNLQPGELVRVKPHREILKTVDSSNRNRGMYWDAELVPYWGGTYRVLKRVSRLIDEKTGKMIEMKNLVHHPDTVVCQARYVLPHVVPKVCIRTGGNFGSSEWK